MQVQAPLSPTIPPGATHVVEVYRYATRKGVIEADDAVARELGIGSQDLTAALEYLLASHLLRLDERGAGCFVPIDPEAAAAALISSVEREIYRRREQIDQIRDRISRFRPDPVGAGPEPSSVEYLVGAAEVRGFLKTASDACREEVLVLLSGDEAGEELDLLASTHLPQLTSRIGVRVLCQHRNRTDIPTRLRMRKLVEAGASVRTVSYVPRAAAVFDRSQAVLCGPPGERTGVARVRNYGVVQFLLDQFNHVWDGAAPLAGNEPGYANVAGDLQRAIACLMAEGYTDEVIARKLDMSVRTCRRHIAALLRDLDAVSRFQAGVLAARRYFAGEAG